MPEVTPRHATTSRRGTKPLYLIVLAVILLVLAFWLHTSDLSAPSISRTTDAPVQSKGFDKNQYSLTNAGSLWLIVNKQHPLNPINYTPPNLVVPNVALKDSSAASNMHVSQIMAPALAEMFGAAANSGLHLMLSSGYRSYGYQVQVYNSIVKAQGQGNADEQSARPGYSEHQSGLAADVAPLSRKCDLQQCFGQTAEGEWLAVNAYKYGFIVRYPVDKQVITGYEYEPWHIRYVGTELSGEMHKQGITTLEELFNVSGGTAYK